MNFLIQVFIVWILMGGLVALFIWLANKINRGPVISEKWDHISAQAINFLLILVAAILSYTH